MSTRGFQDVPPVFEGDPDADPTTGGAPTGDQSKPTVTSLGNGYSLVTWTTQEYDPQIGAVGPKTHSQIVPDKDAASVAAVEAAKIGAGAAGLSASISTAGANQRASVQAEIDRARNAADAAHQQAMDALASGNAAEAKRQFDISQSELTRSHDLDASIRQQEADLGKQKFGFDVYNKLSDLASNPRNYMEQFFRLRGSPPPANAAQYGNGGQQGIVPFEQFLPNFLRSTFGASSSSGQTGAVGAPPSAAPASPALSGPSGASTAGLSGFDAATGKPRLSPTDPDALGLMASHPGMYTMTSPQAAQPYIDQLKKEGNDATVYASSYRQPQQFADGGTLRMTAPHAIVNLLTGRVAAIAGEQPGNGPQGYVPETAKFDGQAIIDPKAPTGATDPFNSDPTGAQSTLDPNAPAPTDPFVAQNLKTPGGLAYPADTTTAPLDTAAGHDNVYVQPTPTETNMPQPLPPGPAPLPFNITSQPAPPGFHWQNGVLVQDAAVTPPPPIPPVTPPQPPITPPVTPPTPPVTPPVTPPTGGAVPPPTVTPPGVTPPTTPPNPTPSFLSSLQALAHTPSGLGKNPTFLPEDAAQKNPIVKTLMDNGAFAPFLQRLYAQNAGLAGLGTNVPQQTDLPAGVPLASRLYLSQLNPSELAAFQSFISAQGLDWNDYLSLVDAASPQGGASTSSNVSYPKFLGQ